MMAWRNITYVDEAKVAEAVALLKKAERLALEYNPEEGFVLAFSGGKDSQAVYHLAKEAGVRFHAFMSLTSVDPPEVIRFVRHNYPDVETIKPHDSIYNLALKRGTFPTMRMRWCCLEYKEHFGANEVTLLGVRNSESVNRQKWRETEVQGKSGKLRYAGDWSNFNEYKATRVTCIKGKDAVLVCPIVKWSEEDVIGYLNSRGIPHCSLYDEGFHRIGCIMCPMMTQRGILRDAKRWPHVYAKWLDTARRMIEAGHDNKGRTTTPEEYMDWWLSKKNIDEWDFDKHKQLKLFDKE